jgi:vacuolar-type H+-ATPase subunit E/Vma4
MTVELHTERPTELRTALDPVRRALIADAHHRADQLVATATTESEAVVDEAECGAQRAVDRAVEHSRLAASAAADQELARANNDAASMVLATQQAAHQRLVSATHAAFLDLRDHPNYPALLDRFAQLARAQLGDGATIERDAEPNGGITATTGSQLVDYSLPTLADRALHTLADRVSQAWT